MKNNQQTIPSVFKETFSKFANLSALNFTDEKCYTYSELESKIISLIDYFEKNNIAKGDKIAIFSQNMPNWGVVYLATTIYGAIVVPLLPDFSSTQVKKILEHAEVKLLFVSERLAPKTVELQNEKYQIKILNNLNELVSEPSGSKIKDYKVQENDLAAIIYTSGTTGNPKGVMLSHKNIASNIVSSGILQPMFTTDRILSILPLSHTYENTLSFLLPLANGCSIFYLREVPTPSILSKALVQIKPTIINSVPMIIEKIYKKQIKPQLTDKSWKRILIKIPAIRKTFHKLAGKKLMKAFGGEIRFFGIGGAKLDPIIEKFLHEAKFPYAIGYGLTETSPLVAGTQPFQTSVGTIGPTIKDVKIELRDINSNGEGEIWIKGPNVMQGYYKEPDLTNQVLKDGWFNSEDLGVINKKGYLALKGRKKNIIIGANGENIYPEDIESIINNFKNVIESVVVEQKGKLVALVHFNIEEIETKLKDAHTELSKHFNQLKDDLQKHVNGQVGKMSKLQHIYVKTTPFEKTPTQKIKRFLYKNFKG